MWHTAWPEKNIGMLIELLPQIKQHTDALSTSQLPGILRDKEESWRRGIANFQAVVNEYELAAATCNTAALLEQPNGFPLVMKPSPHNASDAGRA
jgi:hypothetical protein